MIGQHTFDGIEERRQVHFIIGEPDAIDAVHRNRCQGARCVVHKKFCPLTDCSSRVRCHSDSFTWFSYRKARLKDKNAVRVVPVPNTSCHRRNWRTVAVLPKATMPLKPAVIVRLPVVAPLKSEKEASKLVAASCTFSVAVPLPANM